MNKKQIISMLAATLLLSGCVPYTNSESSISLPSEQDSAISGSLSNEINNAISFTEIPMVFVSGEHLALIIKSAEELSSALEENEWLVQGLPNYWSEFTSDFFANEALIIYSFITESISLTYLIEDLQIDDEVLKLSLISRLYGNLMLDALGFASFVIRVAQKDIVNITSFATSVRREMLPELMMMYDLGNAYQSALTKDDIKHIGFFVSGQLYEIDGPECEWIAIDFVPQIDKPELSMLNEKVIESMKTSYYLRYKKHIDQDLYWLQQNGYNEQNIKGIDTIEVFAFYGKYDGAFAVKITSSLFEYPAVINEVIIDNIGWLDSLPEVVIFI